jgi:hypothetical protein
MGRLPCAIAALLAGAQASRLLRAGPAAEPGAVERGGSPPVEVVVAAWDHAPTWEDKLLSRIQPPPRVRLYCGPSLNDTRCHRIADHGAEEYAFLSHIVENYDRLAPVTVFTPVSVYSDVYDYMKCRKLNFAISRVDTPEKRARFPGFAAMVYTHVGSFEPFNASWDIEHWGGLTKVMYGKWNVDMCRPSIHPLGAWYQHFVDANLSHAHRTGVSYGGIFAVSAERIRRHPRAIYEGLLQEDVRCKSHSTTAAHYMERSWKPMFDDTDHRPDALPGEPAEDWCPLLDKK